MPNRFLELHVYDENGNEILTASGPDERANSDETFQSQMAELNALVQTLRTMKAQKDHRGKNWWAFDIAPESDQAKLFARILRSL